MASGTARCSRASRRAWQTTAGRPPPPAVRSFPRSPCSDRNPGTRTGRRSPGAVRRHPRDRRIAHGPAQRMTPGRDAGLTTPGSPGGERGIMTTTIRRTVRQLSLPLTVLVATLFAAADDLRLVPVSSPLSGPGEARPWHVSLVAAARCGRPGQRGIRLHPVAAPAKVRPRSGRLWLLAPLGKPAARRAARTVLGALRGQSGFARPLVALLPGRAVLLLLLARRPPGHRRPGPKLHGQRLGRSDISRRHGLSLS